MKRRDFLKGSAGLIATGLSGASPGEAATAAPPSEQQLKFLGELIHARNFGQWKLGDFEKGVVGIHAALLHTNEVLFWTYRDDKPAMSHEHEKDNQGNPMIVQNGEWSLLNLSNGKHAIHQEYPQRNQFCGGQCLLADGNVLVVGGVRETPNNCLTVRLFDPNIGNWKNLPDLTYGRYYPTVMSFSAVAGGPLEGNWAYVFGGADLIPEPNPLRGLNMTAQLIAGIGNGALPHGPLYAPPDQFDDDLKEHCKAVLPFGPPVPKNSPPAPIESYYPFVFVLPDRRIFFHLGWKTRLLSGYDYRFNSAKTERLEAVVKSSRSYPHQGTAVLLPLRPRNDYRARIMLIGGGGENQTDAKRSCEILDLGEDNPKWIRVADMINPRIMPDAVLLPDGTVLVVNGGMTSNIPSDKPVMEAEICHFGVRAFTGFHVRWDPMAPMTVERLYHSTALLLPDGRVLTAGTDRQWNSPKYDWAHTASEVFSPPYLFRGPRPTIGWSPDVAYYGTTFDVETDEAKDIKSAVLIRNGSCTHSFNSDQRFVELDWEPIRVRSGATPRLELQAPPNEFIAPQGYYMLFLVSKRGVPSEAKFIRLAH
jgi:hypothetical protein